MDINFSKLTQSILERSQISEAALAKLAGVSQPTIHRIKTGEIKMPRYQTAQKLIDIHAAGSKATA